MGLGNKWVRCLSLISAGWHLIAAAGMVTPGQFSVSQRGSATYSIPLQLPPARAGMAPKLALQYDSQNGNGLLGLGGSLAGLSVIARCAHTTAQDGAHGSINLDANDGFCLDGVRLFAIQGVYGASGTEYRAERADLARIVSYESTPLCSSAPLTGPTLCQPLSPAWFKVWAKDGNIMEYGHSPDAYIEAQGTAVARIWALNQVQDRSGNYFKVRYTKDSANGDFYPRQIDYAGHTGRRLAPPNSVRFQYEARPDPITTYLASSLISNTVRLTHIQTYVEATLVKDYRLQYELSGQTGRSMLRSVTECAGPAGTCLPPTTLFWDIQRSGFSNQLNGVAMARSLSWSANGTADQRWLVGDVDGDGVSDFINVNPTLGEVIVFLNGGQQIWSIGNNRNRNGQWMVADVNGDGQTDLVHVFDEDGLVSIDVLISNGSAFVAQRWETRAGGVSDFGTYQANQKWFVADLDGDGRSDLIKVFDDGSAQVAIDVHLNTGTSFTPQHWAATTPFSFTGPFSATQKWFVADINGDGLADLICVRDDDGAATIDGYQNVHGRFTATTWEFRAGGFWAGQKWFVADANGDGRPDLINVFNDAGLTSVDVHLNTGRSYTTQRWETQAGAYAESQKWFAADVTGDGRADLVNIMNDAGEVSIDVHRSTGTAFQMQRWETKAGPFTTSQTWYLANSSTLCGGLCPVSVAYGPVNNLGIASVVFDEHHGNGFADRVIGIINGLGAHYSINYRTGYGPQIYTKGRSAVYPAVDLSAPFALVDRVRVPTGLDTQKTLSYSYGGLQLDRTGRGMLGFSWMKSVDEAAQLATLTRFRQDWPYVGLPSVVRTDVLSPTGGGESFLSQLEFTYACMDVLRATDCVTGPGQTYFPYVQKRVAIQRDLNGAPLPTTTTRYQIDRWGNSTESITETSGGFSTTTSNTYTNDSVNWLIGQLTGSTTTKQIP